MLFASNSQYNLRIKIVPHTQDDRHDPALSVVIVLNTAIWVKYCGCLGIYCLRRTAFSLIGTSGSILKFLASFTGRGCKTKEMKNIETHCTCLPTYHSKFNREKCIQGNLDKALTIAVNWSLTYGIGFRFVSGLRNLICTANDFHSRICWQGTKN